MDNQTASNKRRQLHTTTVSLFDSAVVIVLCRAAAARVICLFNYFFVVADAVDRGSWLRDSKACRHAAAFLLCVV